MNQQLKRAPLDFTGKSGTASASTTTTIKIDFKDDITKGLLGIVNKVFIEDIIIMCSGKIAVKVLIEGTVVVDRIAISPNFTVIKSYARDKRVTMDIVVILTESDASAVDYDIDLNLSMEV